MPGKANRKLTRLLLNSKELRPNIYGAFFSSFLLQWKAYSLECLILQQLLFIRIFLSVFTIVFMKTWEGTMITEPDIDSNADMIKVPTSADPAVEN